MVRSHYWTLWTLFWTVFFQGKGFLSCHFPWDIPSPCPKCNSIQTKIKVKGRCVKSKELERNYILYSFSSELSPFLCSGEKGAFHLHGTCQVDGLVVYMIGMWLWFYGYHIKLSSVTYSNQAHVKGKHTENYQVSLPLGFPKSARAQKGEVGCSSTWLLLIQFWTVSAPGIP